MDNKINIPWYQATPKMTNTNSLSGYNPQMDIDLDLDRRRKKKRKKKKRNRKRERVRKPQRVGERVRVPSTVTEPDPKRAPNRYPVLDPRQQLNPRDDHGKNPYREPGMNPIPAPVPLPSPAPNPRRDPGASPGVNQKQPMPQAPSLGKPAFGFELPYEIPSPIPPAGYVFKGYSAEQNQWGNDFIKNVEMVARVTAISSQQIYVFVRDYNFETGNLGTFTSDAQAKFGNVAGVILATAVGVKMLGQLWGKRLNSVAGSSFGTIKLDDEFMEEHFNKNIY